MNEAQQIMALMQREHQKLRDRLEARIEVLESRLAALEQPRKPGWPKGRPRKPVTSVEIHEDGPVA